MPITLNCSSKENETQALTLTIDSLIKPGTTSFQLSPQPNVIYDKIEFSNYMWDVKKSENRVGPQNNIFSNSGEDIWVDEFGYLHITLHCREDVWYCTEVCTEQSFGYGIYIFSLNSRVDQFEANTVLGLFTYSDKKKNYHTEIDIEFAKWGDKNNNGAQYVVQPSCIDENIYCFSPDQWSCSSIHFFYWTPQSISFMSIQRYPIHPLTKDYIMASWVYRGKDIPPEGNEKVHMNLYVLENTPPSTEGDIEVIINKFEFIPLN